MNFFLILYTILSIAFLIAISIFKASEDIFISFFAYFFILFVQYRVLIFKKRTFFNYITAHPALNYAILVLGFLYLSLIGVILIKNLEKDAFFYFVLTGCVSSCFYTFFMCKKSIDG